ncbi:sulfite exporter TauE/SafE family protein [Thalassomonas actiniarum]|uniref:Sulfite exporter TauE/SafE family protein n=1 Tax=Thalassomonas actiniarum TaxID=485447 RepID=A0AAF0C1C4_9GAMM|nr:sulfite exporter TauE/SafE family protein [Thalassomonas actiniarum]WDD97267.1 sulfite exporter TauE/SafE family protein [Thalassomonas actiniarum]
MTLDLISAFFIGILGAGHCVMMCGGITTMLTSALPANQARQKQGQPQVITVQPAQAAQQSAPLPPTPSKTILVLCYNLGRIASYSLIGAIIGFTGSLAARNAGMPLAGLRLVAGIFLILLGLYMGQWLMWLNRIEALGKGLWRRISPLSKKVIPVDTPSKALALGGLWGWLPCGLIYSTLTWSMASGSALNGAAIMFFFGLGTLPALVTMSFGMITIKQLLINDNFRKIMAFCIIIYGIYSLLVASRLVF